MKKFMSLFLVLVLSLGILTACGSKDSGEVADVEVKEDVEITISAAASLTDVLGEIEELYKEEKPEVSIVSTFASSGALQAQIEEGAPVDIFMSAAEKQMTALEEQDLLLDGTRKSLLINEVVLITPKDSKLDLEKVEDLTRDDVTKIAIGDPASVPVGQYSEEIFNSLGIKDEITGKLINAEDVRTVLAWVESGEVDCGLVYKTDAATLPEGVNIITAAPQESYKEVSYPVAVIKDSKNPEAAKEFLEFLYTDKVKEIFESYGFGVK